LNLLGVPLLRGRNFTPEESNQGADLAIISESTARLFWPNEDPLGKSFALDMNYQGKLHSFQVIGIAKDARFANLTRIDPAHVYVPIGPSGGPSVGMIVRIYGNPRSALTVAQTLAAPFDKNSFSDMQLINIESGVVAAMRALTQTLTTFAATLAGLALTLAGVGIYGVLSYLVSQRKKEIGIRIALGASPAALLRSTVLKGLRPVLSGMFLGFTAAAAFSFLLHRTLVFPGSMDFLYGVPFYDPVTFVALFCFALLVATIASAVPARRAMQIDPVAAIRCE
jgi:putative ABC transport system permease protein